MTAGAALADPAVARRRLRRDDAGTADLRRRPRLPGGGAALRDGPVEPRHDPGGAALGRLRLARPPRLRLQPHPPERRRLRRLRRLPLPPDHRTADRIARAERRAGAGGQVRARLLARLRERRTGPLLGRAPPEAGREDRRRPDRDDADRLRPLHLPGEPAREPPDRRRRQRPARRRRRSPTRPGGAGDHRQRLERPLLRPAARATRSTSPPASAAPSPPRGPGPKAGSNRGAKRRPTPRRPRPTRRRRRGPAPTRPSTPGTTAP